MIENLIKSVKSILGRIAYKVKRNHRVVYSRLLFNLSDKKGDSRILLASLKNKHQGKRGFIVCNGPSLRAEDLTKIHENGDISIGSNKINKIFNRTPWRPTYYCVADESYQYSLLETINSIPAEVKFVRTDSFMVTKEINSPTVWLNTDGDRGLLNNPHFSESIDKKIYAIATVTYMMIQIMVYMGIRELYIIGCDNSYSVERKKDGTIVNHGGSSYFTGADPKDSKSCVGAIWEMNIAYEFAAKYANEKGIRIFNATRGGNLNSYPRIDFDSLF